MPDLKQEIDRLAAWMEEFQLVEARLSGEDWEIGFSRVLRTGAPVDADGEAPAYFAPPAAAAAAPPDATPTGMPVSSPMQGIFYLTPNPSSPPFVKEGDDVVAGQVVGLIEAMKVFNELYAPVSGRVTKVTKGNGDLVQAGEPLLFIG